MASMVTAANRPAILGGGRAVTQDGAAANRWPIITDEDIAAVTEVLRHGDLSLHPVTHALEDDYRRFFGVKHALAYCNATSAIFGGLHSFGLAPGDEVIVPSATYWASVMPVLWCGAVPVFCETEPDQLGLDPDHVARLITPKTKAMAIVHLWGMPSKMDQLMTLAKEHDLKVLEDASHSHGAKWNGKHTGTFGDVGVFSLQTNKLAPAGEGGVLITDDDAVYEHVQCLGHFERILPMKTPARRFAGTGYGMKHRMAPLSAAVARVQLSHLEARNRKRNDNIRHLSEKLEKFGVRTFLPPDGVERVYFMFVVDNDETVTGLSTDRLVESLRAEGCDVEPMRYPLLHQQPVFTEGTFIDIARLHHMPRESLPTYQPDALPKTVAGNRRLIIMPIFAQADTALLDQYAAAFEKVLGAAAEIAQSGRT